MKKNITVTIPFEIDEETFKNELLDYLNEFIADTIDAGLNGFPLHEFPEEFGDLDYTLWNKVKDIIFEEIETNF